MNQIEEDQKWMIRAIEEAQKAMDAGEHPIGSVLVAGSRELSCGQTSVTRQGSITAHGELMALKGAGWAVFSSEKPLTIYTTLEPCLMCIGAAMQCGVDAIVYSMPAKPDGGIKLLDAISREGERTPEVRSGVLLEEVVALMKQSITKNAKHPGISYAKALIEGLKS